MTFVSSSPQTPLLEGDNRSCGRCYLGQSPPLLLLRWGQWSPDHAAGPHPEEGLQGTPSLFPPGPDRWRPQHRGASSGAHCSWPRLSSTCLLGSGYPVVAPRQPPPPPPHPSPGPHGVRSCFSLLSCLGLRRQVNSQHSCGENSKYLTHSKPERKGKINPLANQHLKTCCCGLPLAPHIVSQPRAAKRPGHVHGRGEQTGARFINKPFFYFIGDKNSKAPCTIPCGKKR